MYFAKILSKFLKIVVPLYPPLENADPYIPKFTYELFDISHMPDEEIKGSLLLKVVLLFSATVSKLMLCFLWFLKKTPGCNPGSTMSRKATGVASCFKRQEAV
jgi:hypothetical protein